MPVEVDRVRRRAAFQCRPKRPKHDLSAALSIEFKVGWLDEVEVRSGSWCAENVLGLAEAN